MADPAEFRWSSARSHLGRGIDVRVTEHHVCLALGTDRRMRAERYGEWIIQTVGEEELLDIRRQVHKQRALGNPRFLSMLERALNRPVTCRERGRPPREPP